MAKRKQSELNGVAHLYEFRRLAEKNVAPDDETFRAKYPKLFSILSDTRISEEQVIDPPILSLKNSSGDWCLSVSVPGLRMYGEVLAPTFDEALAAAELQLGNLTFPFKCNLKKAVVTRKVRQEK